MNHIELTIGELESRAMEWEAKAFGLRAVAVELRKLKTLRLGDLETVRGEPGDGNKKKLSREKAQKAQRVGKEPGPVTAGGRKVGVPGMAPTAETMRLIRVLETLPEPFSAKELAAAGSAPRVRATNAVWRAKERGWIVKAEGWGRFVRTKEFPSAAPAGGAGKVRAVRSPSPRPSPQGEGEGVGSSSGKVSIPEPSEKERRYREMREGMGKIHVPRIGEGPAEEET